MDGDPKSDGDESAASAPSIESSDPHSYVTTERRSREDAVPNFMIERDMVDRVLSTRGSAIPVRHHTIIFVGFVEEHRLICCIVNIHSV